MRSADEVNKILSDARIKVITPSLRRICAVAEGFLEAESVKLIVGFGEDAQDEDAGWISFQPVGAF